MKRPTIKAEKREILGKKVKKLRREGILPANIYGKDMQSLAVQVKIDDFVTIKKEAGDTGVINVEVDGKKYPSLMKNVQQDFKLHVPLHVDFHKVNLKEKIKAMIPVVLIDEAPAVNEKVGMLLQQLSEVEVEALPDNLPETIEISVEGLTELGAMITVADLKAPEDVAILTEPTNIIAKIAEIIEEPEPEVETEEGEEATTVEGEEKTEKAEAVKENTEGEKTEESTEQKAKE